MERKIGQIMEIDGDWYQFVHDNGNGCKSCVFGRSGLRCANPEDGVKCAKWIRKDSKSGHFVRLLPLGDVYEQGGAMWQQYKCIEKPNTEDKRVYIANADSEVALIVSIRLSSKDMEHNTEEVKNEILSNTEKIGKNLKKFDLEAAKSGKPIRTRDGQQARLLCADLKGTKYPVVCAVTKPKGNEEKVLYMINGKYVADKENEHEADLVMEIEKHEGWVNIYKDPVGRVVSTQIVFSCEDSAKQNINLNRNYISTVKINWKE